MVEVLWARGGRYNRKNPNPSGHMLEPDGKRYRCRWIEDSLTIHSDGNVSCGLDDPHGQRSYGNIYHQSVEEIFRNSEFDNLRQKLWDGYRCRDCGHFRAVAGEASVPRRRPALPTRLVIETTVTCNIRCPNLPCIANNDPRETTRDEKFLEFGALKRVIDEVAATLEVVNFYNYGEPFMHRQAEAMLRYIRERCPDAFVVTSTNGIPLSKADRAVDLVRASPDRITFTLAGVADESYSRYHVNGRLQQALQGLSNVCDAKRRTKSRLPEIVWRYLAFHWNDTEQEIDHALALADEFGIDRFSLYLTNTPPGSRSVRLSPGSPLFWKYRKYIHFDDEGKLNQAYRCELPDENGLYWPESFQALGRARWTSSRARIPLPARGGKLHLRVATNRERNKAQDGVCSLRTNWGEFEIPYSFARWTNVVIAVPTEYLGLPEHDVELRVSDHWFPALECGTNDLRCLGVLIKIPGGQRECPASAS